MQKLVAKCLSTNFDLYHYIVTFGFAYGALNGEGSIDCSGRCDKDIDDYSHWREYEYYSSDECEKYDICTGDGGGCSTLSIGSISKYI